ncbi:MAG TPA: hypothetical protein DCY41_06765 [Opitutae bacterium]|nr:hypothetical protein [Opitutae bacterium]
MGVPRELSVLSRLLDDPSPVVQSAVLDRVRQAGDEGMRWLEKLASESDLSGPARDLLRRLRTPEAASLAFLAIARDRDANVEDGLLYLERIIDPSLPDNALRDDLDKLGERARGLLVSPSDIRSRLRTLSRVIFGEKGYRGAEEGIGDPENTLLSHALKTKRGNPFALSLLYLLVARRGGLELCPVDLPGRFMVGYFNQKDDPIYVDCFAGGSFRTPDELRLALRENDLPDDNELLGPTDTRTTLARACRILGTQYAEKGDAVRTQTFLDLAAALVGKSRHGRR